MKTLSNIDHIPPENFDVDLIEHARKALSRVHQSVAGKHNSETKGRTIANASLNNEQQTKKTPNKLLNNKGTKSSSESSSHIKVKYISIKEPPKRTTFYEHSKKGMKYWYDDRQSKRFLSKDVIGRKGTLLGLVDSPYK